MRSRMRSRFIREMCGIEIHFERQTPGRARGQHAAVLAGTVVLLDRVFWLLGDAAEIDAERPVHTALQVNGAETRLLQNRAGGLHGLGGGPKEHADVGITGSVNDFAVAVYYGDVAGVLAFHKITPVNANENRRALHRTNSSISRTARSMPTISALLMTACPMFISSMYWMPVISRTF